MQISWLSKKPLTHCWASGFGSQSDLLGRSRLFSRFRHVVLCFGHMAVCCFDMNLRSSVVVGADQFGSFFVRLRSQLQMFCCLGVVLLCGGSSGCIVGFGFVECHLKIFQKFREGRKLTGRVHQACQVIFLAHVRIVCLITHDACGFRNVFPMTRCNPWLKCRHGHTDSNNQFVRKQI